MILIMSSLFDKRSFFFFLYNHTCLGIFCAQLVAVLREVKYLEQRSLQEIPASAATIYAKNDTFRQYINNLDLTVTWYNKVLIRKLVKCYCSMVYALYHEPHPPCQLELKKPSCILQSNLLKQAPSTRCPLYLLYTLISEPEG